MVCCVRSFTAIAPRTKRLDIIYPVRTAKVDWQNVVPVLMAIAAATHAPESAEFA
jgi:hypothetical protein